VPQLVHVARSDGFTALHLAALDGNHLTAEVLIDVVSYQTVAHRKREQIILFIEQQVVCATYVNFFRITSDSFTSLAKSSVSVRESVFLPTENE
jgi:hypothetical protein